MKAPVSLWAEPKKWTISNSQPTVLLDYFHSLEVEFPVFFDFSLFELESIDNSNILRIGGGQTTFTLCTPPKYSDITDGILTVTFVSICMLENCIASQPSGVVVAVVVVFLCYFLLLFYRSCC
jgi:hypothetical protein